MLMELPRELPANFAFSQIPLPGTFPLHPLSDSSVHCSSFCIRSCDFGAQLVWVAAQANSFALVSTSLAAGGVHCGGGISGV